MEMLCEIHPLHEWRGLLSQLVKKVFDSLNLEHVSNFRQILTYKGPKSHRQWTIDPIDGTVGYTKGLVYAVGIGFMENYVPKASVIAVPPTKKSPQFIYKAIDGKGSWRSQGGKEFQEIKVSTQTELKKSVLCRSLHYDSPLSERFIDRAQIGNDVMVDSMVKFCRVAEGTYDIYFRPLIMEPKIWDFCPGDLLVREAGGKVIDFYRNKFKYQKDKLVIKSAGFLASNSGLYDEILAILNQIQFD